MKEILIAWIPYFVMALSCIITFYISKSSKNDIITKTAKIAVEKVAEHFSDFDNLDKLAIAVNITYELLPKWMKWFVKKKYLEDIVEITYKGMKAYLKSKDKNISIAAMNSALILAADNTKEAIGKSYNLNPNIVHNKQLEEINLKSEEKFNKIWATADYKTNFKNEKELMAQLGFKKEF
jgi:hypothetical protein